MLQPLVRRTWSKYGRTPVLKAWDRHDRLTVITALVYEPHRDPQFSIYFQLQRRNANAASFVWFLTELRKELRSQMIVIRDRLAAHRRTETLLRQLEFPWASFEYLPAYCPQLNPVKPVWATTKYGRLANWPAPDIDQLNDRLICEFEKQQTEQELLKSHFKWAKLELTEDTLLAQ